jgi:hypothetical protein
MKTQIIQLHKNDDHISVRDKMSWSQTGRILLVWPHTGQILNRRLDLLLVRRQAEKMGAQLAFVTNDSDVRFFAEQIRIPVFDNLRQAQKSHWRIDRREKISLDRDPPFSRLDEMYKLLHRKTGGWEEYPLTRLIGFGVSVVALFTLGIFILPAATVYLNPQVKTQSMTFSLTANPFITSINLSTGSLPTYYQEVIVEGSEIASSSGTVIIPDKAAIGGLRFMNISDHDIRIPSGTIVTTRGNDPIRFISSPLFEATIKPGETAVLTARSIKPGTSGNLPANSLVAIEGDLGLDLTVTNPYATHGGANGLVPSPTNQDVRVLHEHLLGKLEQAALVNLQTMLPTDDTLITPTLKIIEIINESATPAVGGPGMQLRDSMRIRFQAQVVAGNDLLSLVTPILDANTPTDWSPILTTLVLDHLSLPTIGEDGNAHWSLLARRTIQADIKTNQAIHLINGLSIQQSISLLKQWLPLASEAQIILSPEWWPSLPFLPMRIHVIQPDIK